MSPSPSPRPAGAILSPKIEPELSLISLLVRRHLRGDWRLDACWKWAIIFLIISLVAGFLGFGGVSAATAQIAKVLFVIFLVIFVITLLLAITGVQLLT